MATCALLPTSAQNAPQPASSPDMRQTHVWRAPRRRPTLEAATCVQLSPHSNMLTASLVLGLNSVGCAGERKRLRTLTETMKKQAMRVSVRLRRNTVAL